MLRSDLIFNHVKYSFVYNPDKIIIQFSFAHPVQTDFIKAYICNLN